jgi:hypothetical protein
MTIESKCQQALRKCETNSYSAKEGTLRTGVGNAGNPSGFSTFRSEGCQTGANGVDLTARSEDPEVDPPALDGVSSVQVWAGEEGGVVVVFRGKGWEAPEVRLSPSLASVLSEEVERVLLELSAAVYLPPTIPAPACECDPGFPSCASCLASAGSDGDEGDGDFYRDPDVVLPGQAGPLRWADPVVLRVSHPERGEIAVARVKGAPVPAPVAPPKGGAS